MHKHSKKEEVYNFLLEIGKEIAKRKLGALFIIAPEGNFKGIYELLYPQVIESHKIFERGSKELILKLAELDGAFLVHDDGTLEAFGARILKSKALPGYGTKHAAATGITGYIRNSTAILVSEENQWIKIFKNGKIVLEMDSSKTPPSVMHKVVTFLTDNDTALLATAGASAAIMGVIPVVIVSGTYLAIKTASGIIKKSLKHNH
ncbi:diadenylate cyclase [Candidatus Woesearchaeota archaeon]|nr:diadenylate cyclase [Candidatus Woesearchaeota archaeon]